MISKKTYITIMILILTIFTMFMFVGISSDFMSMDAVNHRAEEKITVYKEDVLTADNLNLDTSSEINSNRIKVAIIVDSHKDVLTTLLTEWSIYHKYSYKVFTSLPDEGEIVDYKIIAFGNISLTSKSTETLYSYGELGKTMIFTKLPDSDIISEDIEMAEFFGIRSIINKEVSADGIRIFPDFLISDRTYQAGDYYGTKDDTTINVPYYKLSAGYEVYSIGLFNNQKELGIEDKELPPLLWRTKTGNSFIFVVNSDVFDGLSMLGILTGFMTKESECYIYPIVNAQTISMVNYPYFSNENQEVIENNYSRSTEATARDLLWPNIVQVLKNYGKSFNFFAASQLDYNSEIDVATDNIDFYIKEINKLPGNMGLSFGQVSTNNIKDVIEKNYEFYNEYLSNYNFTALFLGDFNSDEINENFDHELLDDITLIMSDYKQGDRLMEFINNDILSIKYITNGYEHETLDDLRMIGVNNALGMSNMKVDIGPVIFPKDSFDEWNKLSLIWSRGKTYYNDFSDFDMVSIYELENRVRRFLALDFAYEYLGDEVNIQIDNFDKEAYFMLSIYDKKIVSIDKGVIEKVSENLYLIKAYDSQIKIKLNDLNYLNKPENNKTVPSNPELRNSSEG